MKRQKAKTKLSKNASAIKEMHNGLPLRVTSNGLDDDTAADSAASTQPAASKAKRKTKSSKHDKTHQAAVDLQTKMETANEKQVRFCSKYSPLNGMTRDNVCICVRHQNM